MQITLSSVGHDMKSGYSLDRQPTNVIDDTVYIEFHRYIYSLYGDERKILIFITSEITHDYMSDVYEAVHRRLNIA